MNELIWISAGITLALLLVIMFGRHLMQRLRSEEPNVPPVQVTRNAPPRRKRHYYGVSIKAGVNTCEAVDKIRNERFLLEDAPKFPLPECNRSDCSCVAIPEDDRRAANDRRRYSFTAYGDYNPNSYFEKREKAKRDRRETDPVS